MPYSPIKPIKKNNTVRSNKISKILLALFYLFLCGAFTAQASSVSLNHDVYEFLERVNLKYDLKLFLNSRPLPKKDVLNALKQLEQHSTSLSQWERKQFHLLRRQFFIHLKKQESRLVYQKEKRQLEGRVSHSTHLNYRDSLPDAYLGAFGTINLGVEGQLDSNLTFLSRVTFAQERTLEDQFTEHYLAAFGMPYNTPEKSEEQKERFSTATFDGYQALLSWNYKDLTLDFGNDWNQWGPGHWQHPTLAQKSWFWATDSSEQQRAWQETLGILQDTLTRAEADSLSGVFPYRSARKGYTLPGENAPLTQIRATINWEFLKYTKFFGEKTGLYYDSPAYVVGHRLESQWGGFTVGIHEILTYSRDEIEASYMIPFVSLFMTEHFTGDRDNIAMGADVQYLFRKRIRMYAELFMDDLVGPGQFFDDYWGNKTAPLIGVDVYDLPLQDMLLRAEYARVDPWVYTHVSGVNQLQNLGSLLGSSLPPNSHALRLQIKKYFLMGIDFTLGYRFFQRQTLTEGSSLFDRQPLESTRKDFLGDHPETVQDFTAQTEYRFKSHLHLSGGVGYQWIKDRNSQHAEDFKHLNWHLMWKLLY